MLPLVCRAVLRDLWRAILAWRLYALAGLLKPKQLMPVAVAPEMCLPWARLASYGLTANGTEQLS